MTETSKNKLYLLAIFIFSFFVWIWTWDVSSSRYHNIKKELDYLKADLAAIQNQNLPEIKKVIDDDTRLTKALERLDSKNIITRYQAGMTIKEFGIEAVPELTYRIQKGSSRERQASILILKGLELDTESFNILKMIAEESIDKTTEKKQKNNDSKQNNISSREVAAIIGILTETKDNSLLPILKKGLKSSDETIRITSASGLRKFNNTDIIPELIELLGKERKMVVKEIEKTILAICRKNPEKFINDLNKLNSNQKYKLCRLLKKGKSVATMRVLKQMINDSDQRIALTAAHMLSLRGNKSGKKVAQDIISDNSSSQLHDIARKIINEIK
ncbi:MAG: HEAT repeat domain-containing protein [Verrucomicrobiota bacterium]|nr:HEAT repeat domain-containing protein [Verrucomicrobiota bacterium]